MIRDAVELEKRGVPVTAIITDEFIPKGREEARSAGMPGLAIVSVPHPIAGVNRTEVAQKADVILEEMIEAMTMPNEKLHERAQQQFFR